MGFSIEEIKKFLPKGSQKVIAKKMKIKPITVSRAWNPDTKWGCADATRELVALETKKLFLEIYDSEMKELAREIRKELRMSSH